MKRACILSRALSQRVVNDSNGIHIKVVHAASVDSFKRSIACLGLKYSKIINTKSTVQDICRYTPIAVLYTFVYLTIISLIERSISRA